MIEGSKDDKGSLYKKLFDKEEGSDREARRILMEKTKPEHERFSKDLLEKMIGLLEAGYRVKGYNEFDEQGLYETVLVQADKEEKFVTEYAFPFVFSREAGKEVDRQEFLVNLNQLLAKKTSLILY
jgi:hypothetical protein